MNLRSKHGGRIAGVLRAAFGLTLAAAGIAACKDVLSWRSLVAESGGSAGTSGSANGGTGGATGGTAGTTFTCTMTPTKEDCSTPEDEACNGNSPDDCGFGGALNDSGGGGTGERHVEAMTVDSDGNPIIAGWFRGPLKLESVDPGYCDRSYDFPAGFVATLDKDSLKCLDIKTLPMKAAGDEIHPTGLAVNPAGEIFVTGTWTGQILGSDGCDLGLGPGKGSFLAKLASSNPFCIPFGSLAGDQSAGLLVQDPYVIVVGSAAGDLTLNDCMHVTAGTTVAFVAGFLQADGTCQWIKTFSGSGKQRITGIAPGANSEFVVVGDFFDTLDSDGSCASETADNEFSQPDMFVARLSGTTAACLWRATYGGRDHQFGSRIVMGATDIFATGEFQREVDGLITTDAIGENMVVLSPLSNQPSSGKARWFQAPTLMDSGVIDPLSLVTVGKDAVGEAVFVASSFYGSLELSGNLLTSSGNEDILLERLTPDGVHVWSKRFGNDKNQRAKALAVGHDSDLFLAGDYSGVIDFGTQKTPVLTNEGKNDIFVVKLSR